MNSIFHPPKGGRAAGLFAAVFLSMAAGSPAFAQTSPHGSASPAVKTMYGKATYYGGKHLDGKSTASGDTFDHRDNTAAASKAIPLGSTAKVTNLENGKSVEVEVNDRGRHVRGRHIDLSRNAAREIGITKNKGSAPVKIEVTKPPVKEADSAKP
jgi:rare lipoprotein A